MATHHGSAPAAETHDLATPHAAPPAETSAETHDLASSELPVVARLVVEIRTDGTRTVARGAVEDPHDRVMVRIEGGTPLELVVALTRALLEAPFKPWRLQRPAEADQPTSRRPSALRRAITALLPGGRTTR